MADFRLTTLPHRLETSPLPEKRLIETMTGGVAAFDFDNDGFIDLFFANGAEQPSLRKTSPKYWNRLYRNDGGKAFVDITEASGLRGDGFSMGAAAADFDEDGFTDLFVSGVNGTSILYRNAKGVFKPVALPPIPGWAVGGGWFDYDHDGRLDLFVVKYVVWDPANEPACGTPKARTYCHPREYAATANQLLHNQGDGTFTDVSAKSGIGKHAGKGMSVAFGDIDGDGWPDAFVTNDTTPNFLFRNRGDGTFEEVATRAGVAWNDDGRALSAMGADFRDLDNDGRDDIFYTALVNETFPFLRNLGRQLLFADLTYASRIGAATMTRSGWGTGINDFDNDGRKDIFTAGGDVQTNAEVYSSRQSHQRCLLLWNQGATFRPEELAEPALHRGAAFADFDNNGTIDIAVSRLGAEPAVLINRNGAGNHWIGFRSRTLGVHITIGQQHNHATTAVGYASSSDPRVHFGLSGETAIKQVTLRWPSGKVTTIANPPVDRYLDIAEN